VDPVGTVAAAGGGRRSHLRVLPDPVDD
jgi:hypothetical protein